MNPSETMENTPTPPEGWAIVPADDPRLDCLPCMPLKLTIYGNWVTSIYKGGQKMTPQSKAKHTYALPIQDEVTPPASADPKGPPGAAKPLALARQEGGSHYKEYTIQPVEFIHANKLPFLEACVLKRICRHRRKNGAEDIRKAIHELELILELDYPADKARHPSCPD